MRALLGYLAALAAVGAPLDESEWGRRASDVRDAIREAFGAYAAGAGGFDVLVPESASGEDVMGSQVTLIEALDTLFVAGLREEYDAAVATLFRGGWRDPLGRGVAEPTGAASPYQRALGASRRSATRRRRKNTPAGRYASRVVGGLLGAFEVSGDRRLLHAAAHAAETVLDSMPDARPVVPPKRARLVHARTAPVRYAVARLLARVGADDGGCANLGEAGGFGLELRALSRDLDDGSFASAADAIFDEVDALWAADGARGSDARLPSFPGCARDDRRGGYGDGGGGVFFQSLLKEQFIGSAHGAARAAALYDWFEDALPKDRDVLVDAGRATFLADPWTRAVEASAFHVPATLALGAWHPFRKGNADDGDKRTARDLAACLAEAVHVAHRAAGGLAPRAFTVDPGDARSDVRLAVTDPSYDLGHEYAETLFVLYRTTGDETYRARGWDLFADISRRCAVDAKGRRAFAGLVDVSDVPRGRARAMPPHVVGATLKFLFLLFSSPSLYPLDDWVFTSRGHLIKASHRCDDDQRPCTGPEDRPRLHLLPVDLLCLGACLVLLAPLFWRDAASARRKRHSS